MEITRPHAQSGKRSPQLVHTWEQKDNRFYLYCKDTALEVAVYQSNIVRFRYSPEGRFEDDFSYSLISEGNVPDPQHPYENEGGWR